LTHGKFPEKCSTDSAALFYSFFLALVSLCASRPLLILSRIFSRSLSSLSFVTTTLLGWMPIGTDWPLDFSRETRSMWMRYFSR